MREPAAVHDGAHSEVGLRLPRGLAVLIAAAARVELALEGLAGLLERTPQRIGALLQRAHTGKLRFNLLWALVALAPVLLAMLSALVRMP